MSKQNKQKRDKSTFALSQPSPVPANMMMTPASWAWMASQMHAMQSAAAETSTQSARTSSLLRKPAKKQCDDSSDEGDLSDDEFVPKKKAKASAEPKKRGRPSKADLERRKSAPAASAASSSADSCSAAVACNASAVSKYPKPFDETGMKVAFLEKGECSSCFTYVGTVILKPCGHSKYCLKCINKLRKTAQKLSRPAKCLNSDCYSLVKSWLIMNNIHVKTDEEQGPV